MIRICIMRRFEEVTKYRYASDSGVRWKKISEGFQGYGRPRMRSGGRELSKIWKKYLRKFPKYFKTLR